MYDIHDQEIIFPFENTQWPNYPPINYENQPQLLPPRRAPSRLNQLDQAASVQELEPEEEIGAMKEMAFKIAAMQPVVDIDPTTIRKRKRRNVHISDDQQSVMARNRRERISEKIRILQRLVPGGTKMDIGSMLEEAVRYVKFLKRQIRLLQGLNYNLYHPISTPGKDWPSSNSASAGTSYDVFGGNSSWY